MNSSMRSEDDIEDYTSQEVFGRFKGVLTDREEVVLCFRFGLDGCKRSTLQEVASMLGLKTRERVRQIQNIALFKLRRALRKDK